MENNNYGTVENKDGVSISYKKTEEQILINEGLLFQNPDTGEIEIAKDYVGYDAFYIRDMFMLAVNRHNNYMERKYNKYYGG